MVITRPILARYGCLAGGPADRRPAGAVDMVRQVVLLHASRSGVGGINATLSYPMIHVDLRFETRFVRQISGSRRRDWPCRQIRRRPDRGCRLIHHRTHREPACSPLCAAGDIRAATAGRGFSVSSSCCDGSTATSGPACVPTDILSRLGHMPTAVAGSGPLDAPGPLVTGRGVRRPGRARTTPAGSA